MSEPEGLELHSNVRGLFCLVCGRDFSGEIFPTSDPELLQAGYRNYMHMRCWEGAADYFRKLELVRQK